MRASQAPWDGAHLVAEAGNKIQDTHSQQGAQLCAATAWKNAQKTETHTLAAAQFTCSPGGAPQSWGQRSVKCASSCPSQAQSFQFSQGPGDAVALSPSHLEKHVVVLSSLSSRTRLKWETSADIQFLCPKFRLWSLCFSDHSRRRVGCKQPLSLQLQIGTPYLQPSHTGTFSACSSQAALTGRSQTLLGLGLPHFHLWAGAERRGGCVLEPASVAL